MCDFIMLKNCFAVGVKVLRVSLSSIVLGWRLEGARLCVASGDGTQNHRLKWSIESGWCFGLEVGSIVYAYYFSISGEILCMQKRTGRMMSIM